MADQNGRRQHAGERAGAGHGSERDGANAHPTFGGYPRSIYDRGFRDPSRGPHRGRGPKGYVRSDARIREDLSDRLTDAPDLDASDVEVTVAGGEVTLNGTIERRTDKRRAEDIAEEISGVRHVQNNLRVRQVQNRSGTESPAIPGVGSATSRAEGTSRD